MLFLCITMGVIRLLIIIIYTHLLYACNGFVLIIDELK